MKLAGTVFTKETHKGMDNEEYFHGTIDELEVMLFELYAYSPLNCECCLPRFCGEVVNANIELSDDGVNVSWTISPAASKRIGLGIFRHRIIWNSEARK